MRMKEQLIKEYLSYRSNEGAHNLRLVEQIMSNPIPQPCPTLACSGAEPPAGVSTSPNRAAPAEGAPGQRDSHGHHGMICHIIMRSCNDHQQPTGSR